MKHLQMEMTLNELLKNPYLVDEMKYLIDSSILKKVPKVLYGSKLKTLAKLAPTLNWNEILDMANMLVDKKIAEGSLHVALWSQDEVKKVPQRFDAVLFPFIVNSASPAVLVCPGGGYNIVASVIEGFPVALALNKAGYNAYVINYRHGTSARFPAPMEDVARAIQYIRKDKEQFVSLWGSSAGGHLAAYFGARWMDFGDNTSPDCLVLSYPVITMDDGTHKETRSLLLGEKASVKDRAEKSVQNLVTDKYPPTFVWCCKDDKTVDPAANSGALEDSLLANGVRHEVKYYLQGGHGCALAIGTSAEGWFEKAIDFVHDIEANNI